MDSELKNCPFTGEVPKVDVWTPECGQHRDYGRGVWIVTIKSSSVEIKGSSMQSKGEAQNDAIEAWNKRVNNSAAKDERIRRCQRFKVSSFFKSSTEKEKMIHP